MSRPGQGDYPGIDLVSGPRTVRPHHFALDATGFRLNEGMAALDVRWPVLFQLRLVDPCPCFEVEWRHVGGRAERRFESRFDSERREVEAEVIALAEHVRDHRPHALDPGWLAHPDLAWEQVSRLPEETTGAKQGEGAYRSARVAPEERILATWGPPTPLGTMLQWLASSPHRPWREHPQRVVLTEQYVYAERRDGTFARLPLEALRARHGEDDAVYVFGRKTPLLLPEARDDGVRRILDRRLSSKGA